MVAALKKYNYFKDMQVYSKPVSRITSIGVEIPLNLVDNETLTESIDAPPELKRILPKLIYRATKCRTRAYAAPGTCPTDLALAAARKALDKAGLDVDDIDTLIFSSTDMASLEPATACIMQERLGLQLTNAFDVSNACNSFLQAINVANSLIATGAAKKVLITSGEIGSYVCNREIKDKKELEIKMGGLTLGDAGAAMILEASDGTSGFQEINLLSIGEHWPLCHVPETTDWRQREDGSIHGWFYLHMPKLAQIAKRETKKYFLQYKQIRDELYDETFFLDQLHHVIPHQISRKFIEDIAHSLNFDMSNICVIGDVYGNTASTSIPLVLQTLIDQGELVVGSGQEVFLYGAASGFGLGHIRLKL